MISLSNIYIKACVQNKAQLCASSACIFGYVLSDKEQTELMTRERRKNYWENTSIYLLNPDTAL